MYIDPTHSFFKHKYKGTEIVKKDGNDERSKTGKRPGKRSLEMFS